MSEELLDITQEGSKPTLSPKKAGKTELEIKAAKEGAKESIKNLNVKVEPQTTLSANPNSINITVNANKQVAITTNAQDFSFEVIGDGGVNDFITATKANKNITITGKKAGTGKLKVKATAQNASEKAIDIAVTITADAGN